MDLAKANRELKELEALKPPGVQWSYLWSPYMRYVLPFVLFYLLAILGACSLAHQLDIVEKGAVRLDVAIERRADAWADRAAATLAHCQSLNLESRAERLNCLGDVAQAPEVAEYLEKLTTLQGLVHDLLQTMKLLESRLPE